MNTEQNFYTVKQLYELLDHNVSKTTLQVMIRNGKIPSVSFMSKRLVPGAWVRENLLAAGEIKNG